MTGYQDSANPMQQAPQPKKGWFGRNWWWFLALVIGGPLLCCCGGPIGMMFWGASQFKNLPPYQDSIALAQQSPELQQALGSPIEPASLFSGNFSFEMNNNDMTGKFPIQGPNGSGVLFVEGELNSQGNWLLKLVEAEVNGQTYDLLNAGSTGAAGTPASGDTAEDDADDPSQGDGTR